MNGTVRPRYCRTGIATPHAVREEELTWKSPLPELRAYVVECDCCFRDKLDKMIGSNLVVDVLGL